MKKIAIFRDKRFNNNNFYNTNIDKNLSPFFELVSLNWNENTISLNLLKNHSDRSEYVIICFLAFWLFSLIDYIKFFLEYPKNKKYLVLLEPKVVAPLSYLKIFHLFFKKILTRNDNLINNKKYFKFIWPQSSYGNRKAKKFEDKKFLTLINGNKYSLIENELYSEREKAIRYFESKNIEFDLYGTNRNIKNLKQRLLGYKMYPSYKWKINNKLDILSEYKFNICFENMKDIPGYITEKIWDSFKAKSIPIYLWASNIEQYVPYNCFIDFRKFDLDYDKLIQFLLTMNENEYNKYMLNIEVFLNSITAQQRFEKKWAENFLHSL